jgi:hypothetical protein
MTSMRNLKQILACISLLVAPSVVAQVDSYERILFPVVIKGEVPGAFGSRWTTRVAITNTADNAVFIEGYDRAPFGCPLPCPFNPTIVNTTFFPTMIGRTLTQGGILLVDRQFSDKVEVHLRVQDLSRQAETWGTEIPTIRERDLFQSAFDLLDLPVNDQFRDTLRIYDFDAVPDGRVLVRFFRSHPEILSGADPNADRPWVYRPDEKVYEVEVPLQSEGSIGSISRLLDFGYAEIGNLNALPQLAGTDRLRIQIQPITPGLRLWAFASITHNQTQHVTIVTPSHP